MGEQKKDALPAGALYDLARDERRLYGELKAAQRRWDEAQNRLADAFGSDDPFIDHHHDDDQREAAAVVLAGPEGTFVVVNDPYSATVYPAVIRTVDGV